jgi:hypothetical protein
MRYWWKVHWPYFLSISFQVLNSSHIIDNYHHLWVIVNKLSFNLYVLVSSIHFKNEILGLQFFLFHGNCYKVPKISFTTVFMNRFRVHITCIELIIISTIWWILFFQILFIFELELREVKYDNIKWGLFL